MCLTRSSYAAHFAVSVATFRSAVKQNAVREIVLGFVVGERRQIT